MFYSIRIRIARLHWRQGHYDEAEQLYIKVLETHRQILGNTHPDTLRYIENLAGLYHEQGRYDDAEPLLVQALEKQRQILGEDHPDTLITMNNLGVLYSKLGRHDAAELFLGQTIDGRQRVLGNEHPSTLNRQTPVNYLSLREKPTLLLQTGLLSKAAFYKSFAAISLASSWMRARCASSMKLSA